MGPVYIACTFDKAMAVPALVLAWSVKQTMKPGRRVVFYAVACEDDAIPDDAGRFLNSEFFDFRPVRAPSSDLYSIDISHSIVTSLASLARIDLPEFILEADRLLYLDCDIIVRRPLDALFDLNMDKHVIGACVDYLLTELSAAKAPRSKYARHIASLVSDPLAYFNSGVLLIDCVKWRANEYSAQLKSFLLSATNKFMFADQDALNFIFQSRYRRLDPRWNSFAHHPTPFKDQEVAALAALCDSEPWITHFSGGTKPWMKHQTKTVHHDTFWEIVEASPFHAQMIELSDSTSLPAMSVLGRTIAKTIAEFLMTFSRRLHSVEVRVSKNPQISLGIFDVGEDLYQRASI